MAIHGYRVTGEPMFDNMKEFATYERLVEEQRILNQNKFDYIYDVDEILSDMRNIISEMSFGGVTTDCLLRFDTLKSELDDVCNKMIDAPKERFINTDLVDEFVGKCKVNLI